MTDWMKSLAGIGYSNRKLHLFQTYTGIVLGWLCAVCIIVMYQSLANITPPVTFGVGRIAAWPADNGGSIIISYTRSVDAQSDVRGMELRRSINCTIKGYHQTFDLPVLVRNYSVDSPQNVNRLITYPYPVPAGTRCEMATMVQWEPTLSVNKHTFTLPRVPFVVSEEPVDVREMP